MRRIVSPIFLHARIATSESDSAREKSDENEENAKKFYGENVINLSQIARPHVSRIALRFRKRLVRYLQRTRCIEGSYFDQRKVGVYMHVAVNGRYLLTKATQQTL